MKYSQRGNEKLGKRVVVISRPVGDSCPSDCYFLNNGCYRQKTENRFPNARESSQHNMSVTVDELTEMIEHAIKNKKPIRLHEGGDFLRVDGKVDKRYINKWKLALQRFDKTELPHLWVYSHVYDSAISSLSAFGIHVYASVHNEKDFKKASKEGFTLFAWVTKIKKKKGGSKEAPKYLELPVIGRTLVCPEQRMGRKRVTCEICKWCIEGKGNVAFLDH